MNWYKRHIKIGAGNRGWTAEELEKIKKLMEEGYNTSQIGDMFGVNRNTILKLNKKYKWKDFKKEREEKYKWLASLYLLPPKGEGMPAAKIYEQYGIGRDVVRLALKSLDLMEHWRGNSEAQRKMIQDNPDILRERSEKTKQFYKDNPFAAKQHAEKMRQLYIDEPERRDEISKIKKQEWRDIGGLEGRLKSYSNRNEAINYLNKFISNKIQQYGKVPYTYQMYNRYMDIINNHTYPDEVQQEVIV